MLPCVFLDFLVVFFLAGVLLAVPAGAVVEAPGCGGGGAVPWASASEVEPTSITPIASVLNNVIAATPVCLTRGN